MPNSATYNYIQFEFAACTLRTCFHSERTFVTRYATKVATKQQETTGIQPIYEHIATYKYACQCARVTMLQF